MMKRTSYLVLVLFLSLNNLSISQVDFWKAFNTQNSSVPGDYFYCIGIDAENNIWLAHHIICKWDKKSAICYTSYPYLGSDIVHLEADLLKGVWLSLESPWIIKTDGTNWETQ